MKILMWLSIGLDRRTPSEHLLTAIAEALCAQGHKVHILQKATGGNKAALPSKMEACGVTTSCVSCEIAEKSDFVSRYFRDIQYAIKCREQLKKQTYDRVFLQSSNVAGIQAALLKRYQPGAKLIFNVQDIFPENAVYSHKLAPNGIKYRLLSAEQRHAYSAADEIITISEDMKQQLEDLHTDGKKISVIYNWSYQDGRYDIENMDCTTVRKLLPEDRFNVVYAGNIGLMQNVELLIQAAELTGDCPEILYHIIGDGLYREKLEAAVREKNIKNVVFGKMLPSEMAPALYCTADVNIIPLSENIYKTALPSKTATCLACGKPIIFCLGRASRFAMEMEKQGGCLSVDSTDAAALAEQIKALVSGYKLNQRNDEVLERFSITRNSRKYAEIIVK